MLDQLQALKGKFWTSLEEMVAEIQEQGFEVEDYNEEYVEVDFNEEEHYTIHLIVAGSTIAVQDIN